MKSAPSSSGATYGTSGEISLQAVLTQVVVHPCSAWHTVGSPRLPALVADRDVVGQTEAELLVEQFSTSCGWGLLWQPQGLATDRIIRVVVVRDDPLPKMQPVNVLLIRFLRCFPRPVFISWTGRAAARLIGRYVTYRYVPMYVCIYIYIYKLYTYVHIYINMYICIHKYVYICV